nr:hypothetical protein [Salinivirgaceae bacterium]
MRTFLLLITLTIVGNLACGQNKKPLTIDDLQSWNHLRHQQISSNGQFVAYEVNPYKGDGELRLWNAETNKTTSFKRGHKAVFAFTNAYLAFLVKPQHDSLRAAKLAKVKKENLPKDSLFIYTIGNKKTEHFEKVKSVKVPRKGGNYIAWIYESSKESESPTDSTATDSAQAEKKGKEKKYDKNAPESHQLVVYNPLTGVQHTFNNATEFEFSENGANLMCIVLQNDTLLKSSIIKFDTQQNIIDTVFSQHGLTEKITINKDGSQWAFVHSADSIKEKVYSLYAWNKNENQIIADTLSEELPTKWTVSKNGKLYFTDNGERLYFGAARAPRPAVEDTLLPSEKVHLDLWSWTDGKLQPEQLAEKKKKEQKSYLSYWDVKKDRIVMIEDTVIKSASVSLEGEGQYAIGFNHTPYEKRGSWEMPYYKDVYKIDLKNGEKTLITKETQQPTHLSNSGNYISYYSYADSNWYVYDIKKEKLRNLTKNIDVDFYQREHDYPNDADPYYYAGWTENDDYFLIYDEFDVWQVDPTGKEAPRNITQGYGRKNSIRFRYIRLDREAKFINSDEDLYLHAFNNTTKAWGYYRTKINSSKAPEKLIVADYRIYYPAKAELADKIIWKKGSFEDYPEVWYSNLDIENPVKVSETNPQQKEYNWGKVELVKWITAEGTEEEGLLYKPENFDPNKKYPMMVYFYRLYSDDIHRHYTPKPSRSVINFSYYVSNEYLLFIPNIRYKSGYPGESAVNYVVSG